MTVIGLVGEDETHFWVATRLIDDALVAGVDWIEGVVESCRSWQGRHGDERWYKYSSSDAYDLRPITIDGVTIKLQGRIGGEPLKPEAGMWRKVLLRFVHTDPRPDIVVVVRDLDGRDERRAGIDQVRNGLPWPFVIVAATPQPEIEAWIVAGFVPRDREERARLDAASRELSFDPTIASHRLTSHPNDAATDAKRVLARLCGGDREREQQCLDRELLHHRGAENRAREFLDEVGERVLPVFRER